MRNTAPGTTTPALPEDTPLLPGDRIRSAHAGRTGRVVKVYPDASACVHWDDRVPQAEGLGHERMPRHLLVKIEPTTTVDLAAAARDFARLIESGAIGLDAAEDTIGTADVFLAAVAAQPAPVSTDLSTDAVDVRFALEVLRAIADDYPDRLPADLHARATEAVERLESRPFALGGEA
ncbi:MAG: hypothetical protein E6R11_06065 [Rhodocyclaceae bacterium]|nr:MAG: hypothetical protein E6R11_06065 [Rhodocyclaceae bacterium]